MGLMSPRHLLEQTLGFKFPGHSGAKSEISGKKSKFSQFFKIDLRFLKFLAMYYETRSTKKMYTKKF